MQPRCVPCRGVLSRALWLLQRIRAVEKGCIGDFGLEV